MNRGVASSLRHLYIQRNDLNQFIKNMEAIWSTSEREVESRLGPAPTYHPQLDGPPPCLPRSSLSVVARKAALKREVMEVVMDVPFPVRMGKVLQIMYDRHPDQVKEWTYHSRIQGLVHELVEDGCLARLGPGQYRRAEPLERALLVSHSSGRTARRS